MMQTCEHATRGNLEEMVARSVVRRMFKVNIITYRCDSCGWTAWRYEDEVFATSSRESSLKAMAHGILAGQLEYEDLVKDNDWA